jgi:CheY-like chemotaxis protein
MKTILIVDDDQNILIVLSELVRISLRGSHVEPVEIMTAASGEDAIRIINGRNVDLLLTDYHMPGMNGFDLIRSLLGSPIHMAKVLMSSDRLYIEELVRSGLEGIDAIVEKPIDRMTLKQILHKLL